MAAKNVKAKTKTKRAAPKGKAKGKSKSTGKTATRKAKTSGTKPASRTSVKAKPKRKPATKRASPPTRQPPAPLMLAEHELEGGIDVDVSDETAAAEPKKGAFARLAGGVGNLFARVTGKKSPEPQAPSPDQTIVLNTGDIMVETAAPPPVPKPKA